MKNKAVFITGPTASGKSDLAIWLARQLNGEVVNADSRQVYKYLDIGSGKISKQEAKIAPHHLLSLASPKRNFSLKRWLSETNKVILRLTKLQKTAIICGGTILYLRALQEGWVLPEVKPDYKLRRALQKLSTQALLLDLKKIDAGRAAALDPANKRRLIRALEIVFELGEVPPLKKEPKYNLLILAPAITLAKLRQKIYKRLVERSVGIVAEIKKLRRLGLSFARIISFGLEYKWFGRYVKARETNNFREAERLVEAVENCYKDTLRFAKRQIRTLQKIKKVHWVKNRSNTLRLVQEFFQLDQ